MAQSITSLFRDGQNYMSEWPMEPELYAVFPECRVIAATRLSLKLMPPLAVVTAALLINVQGIEFLPQAIAVFAFFLSLPMQGLLWLGFRSNQLLSPSMKSWYREIHQKLRAQGCQVQAAKTSPRYRELARVLNTAFSELDRVFTHNWL